MSDPTQNRSFQRAIAIARQVLPFLGEKGIPPNPENYMIFFLYFEGDNDMLKRVVDSYLDSEAQWTNEITKQIFSQLFSSQANINFYRLNEKLVKRAQDTTKEILDKTNDTAEVTGRSSQRLRKSLEMISRVKEAREAAANLTGVLDEIRNVSDASSNLSGTLKEKGKSLTNIIESLGHMEALALTDELTQLANRRAWDARLQWEFQRFRRFGHACSLLMLDIDDFKKVNDTHGHLAGDEVLKGLAKILTSALREVDLAARFGGEEFTVLLPETDHVQANIVAEKLRTLVERADYPVKDLKLKVTVSFGVASFQAGDKEPDRAFNRADQAMYMAKKSGKNRVCSEEEL